MSPTLGAPAERAADTRGMGPVTKQGASNRAVTNATGPGRQCAENLHSEGAGAPGARQGPKATKALPRTPALQAHSAGVADFEPVLAVTSTCVEGGDRCAH